MNTVLLVVVLALLVVLHRQVHRLNRAVTRLSRKGHHMSQELDGLVVQVAETNGTMQAAVVAFGGVTAKLDALAAELAAQGIDNTLVVAASTDLKVNTDALAAAIVNVPA